MTKKLYIILLISTLLLLPGCFGGSKSDALVEAEIEMFFKLYGYAYQSGDVAELLEMCKMPLSLRFGESAIEFVVHEKDAIYEALAYLDENVWFGGPAPTKVETIVGSISGTTADALATVLVIAEYTDDDGVKWTQKSKGHYGLIKSSGRWRIKSIHTVSIEPIE